MIELLGFDEDSIEFGISGELAMQIAKLCGSPFQYEPNRTKAVCRVTLFGDHLTPEFCSVNTHATSGDANQSGFFDCPDVDCRK